jgi:hypothetical protein
MMPIVGLIAVTIAVALIKVHCFAIARDSISWPVAPRPRDHVPRAPRSDSAASSPRSSPTAGPPHHRLPQGARLAGLLDCARQPTTPAAFTPATSPTRWTRHRTARFVDPCPLARATSWTIDAPLHGGLGGQTFLRLTVWDPTGIFSDGAPVKFYRDGSAYFFCSEARRRNFAADTPLP